MTFKELLEQELAKFDEALEQPLPWEWRMKGPGLKVASFEYETDHGEETVLVGFEADWDFSSELTDKIGIKKFDKSWSLEFRLEDGMPEDITSHHKSFKILSTVIDIVSEFAYEEKPASIIIEAESLFIDRTSVYLKILERNLPPNYDVGFKRRADDVFDVIHIVDKDQID